MSKPSTKLKFHLILFYYSNLPFIKYLKNYISYYSIRIFFHKIFVGQRSLRGRRPEKTTGLQTQSVDSSKSTTTTRTTIPRPLLTPSAAHHPKRNSFKCAVHNSESKKKTKKKNKEDLLQWTTTTSLLLLLSFSSFFLSFLSFFLLLQWPCLLCFFLCGSSHWPKGGSPGAIWWYCRYFNRVLLEALVDLSALVLC